jgi:hypothetical protein
MQQILHPEYQPRPIVLILKTALSSAGKEKSPRG